MTLLPSESARARVCYKIVDFTTRVLQKQEPASPASLPILVEGAVKIFFLKAFLANSGYSLVLNMQSSIVVLALFLYVGTRFILFSSNDFYQSFHVVNLAFLKFGYFLVHFYIVTCNNMERRSHFSLPYMRYFHI